MRTRISIGCVVMVLFLILFSYFNFGSSKVCEYKEIGVIKDFDISEGFGVACKVVFENNKTIVMKGGTCYKLKTGKVVKERVDYGVFDLRRMCMNKIVE